MALPKKTADPGRTKKILSFLRDSFTDYIAARVLFNSQLPEQAAVLSSTAIEKAVKAMLAVAGNESHGHLKKAHRNFVKNFNPSLHALLDDGFLELNQHIYRLRYTDDLPVEYTVVIASREFLAEMDYTISAMFSCFSFDVGGKPGETPYTTALRQSDSRLINNNHVIAGVPKSTFIYQEPQFVYEVRNDGLRGLMQITYVANGPPKRSGFLRAGCVPKDAGRTVYDLAFGNPDPASPS